MKRLAGYITGLVFLLGSIYALHMPAMADTDEYVPPCTTCIEETQPVNQCDSPETEDDQHIVISTPVNGNCDCDFNKTDNSEPTGVLFSNAQTYKGKIFAGVVQQEYGYVSCKNKFVGSNTINAPPASYLTSLNTVQQLK